MRRTFFCISAIALASHFASGATFTVENTDDIGPGSLRQAILDNNASPSATNNLIHFNVPNAGPNYVYISTALPAITQRVTIDGYTQPGASANTLSSSNNAVILIRLDGSGSAEPTVANLRLQGGPSIVRGLSITYSGSDGIEITGAGGHVVEGNFIGVDVDGSSIPGNQSAGVKIENSSGNKIGGTTSAARNIISGNTSAEILLSGNGASNNLVQGNLIGVDQSGTFDRGYNVGILLTNCQANVIGGNTTPARNIISGENTCGILVSGTSISNKLQGNVIGTDLSGTVELGNGEGIFIDASVSSGNLIGGTNSGEGNMIAFNYGRGIHVSAGTNFAVRGNSIFNNTELGLDLGAIGPEANDALDADSGANHLQNFPVITNALVTTTNVAIQGTLHSHVSATFSVDFFSSPRRDASGYGEGHKYLGATNVTTDGSGNGSFSVTFNSVPSGRYVSATATDINGNTSEFSSAFAAAGDYPLVTFTVTNTNDNGAGSLRQAILTANYVGDQTNITIAFNIPGSGPHVIAPTDQLPGVLKPTLIDGYSQPGSSVNTASNGFNAVLKIQINGGGLFLDGLQLSNELSVVRGIAFTRCYNGVALSGFDHRVEGCVAGLTPLGLVLSNFFGVSVIDGSGHRIGGTALSARNVFSGNSLSGVQVSYPAFNCVVQGNLIGTDFTGTTAAPNRGDGIYLNNTTGNLIGGSISGACNVISGNLLGGIFVYAAANRIEGNYIGLNASGTAALPNLNGGVTLQDALFNVIGGTTTAARNVISGNQLDGVRIFSYFAVSNKVIGNFIGTDASGANPVPNLGYGVSVTTEGNSVGGPATGEGNRIAFNQGSGVYVVNTNCAIRKNEIFSNDGLGIDFGFGVVTNDFGDEDEGANHLQNFPVLTSATINVSSTRIQGTLNSFPNTVYTLDFFSSLNADPSGFGEGQKYLGSTNVTTGAGGNVNFDVTFPMAAVGRQITATATDPENNTSPFSEAFRGNSTIPPTTFTVVNTNDSGAGSLRQAILDSALFPASLRHTIAFNIPGTNVFTISPLTPLPSSSESVAIDGFTQTGASAATLTNEDNAVRKIRLSGHLAGAGVDGFTFLAKDNVLRGLEITGFSGDGVKLIGPGNVIEGCYIFSNAANGVSITNVQNVIGGITPAKRNVISGNGSQGIEISGAATAANFIAGNFIGAQLNGLFGLPNGGAGIRLNGAFLNTIGGGAEARNIIGANLQGGIELTGGAISNFVRGNYIGATPLGSNLGNANGGVRITVNARNNIIGEPRDSTGTSFQNLIAFNQQDGIYAESGTNNTFRANRIFENGHLGIDLFPNAVNQNDNTDNDTGANFKQNFPLVTNALLTASNLVVQGTLNSRPNTSYQIDFFRNVLCDPSLHGEGEYFIGTAFITTDLSGNAVFNVSVAGNNGVGSYVTCTATDPVGNTSEFSPCTQMNSEFPPQTFTVTTTADSGPGSLRQAIINANATAASGPHLIGFDIPGTGPHHTYAEEPYPPIAVSMFIHGSDQPGSEPRVQMIHIHGGSEDSWDDAAPLFEILADDVTFEGVKVVKHIDVGLLIGGNGVVVDNCAFGGVGDDEEISADAIQFQNGSSGEVRVAHFSNIRGDAVSANGLAVVGVTGCIVDDVDGKLLDQPNPAAPATPVFQNVICQGENGIFVQVQVSGPPNTQSEVEVYRVSSISPLSCMSAELMTANIGSDGTGVCSTTTERLAGTIGIVVTQTRADTNTSASSSAHPVGECEFIFENFLTGVADKPQSGAALDPISTFSGELYDSLPPDFSLGGPMPLFFQRFYGSRLVADAKITGKLGENWLHNFDMKLSNKVSTVEVVLYPGMFLVFTNQTGLYNLLNRPDAPFQLRATNADFILGDPRAERHFTFNNSGRLAKIEDGRGNAHTLSYVGANLNTVSDGLGRTLSFQYNAGNAFLTNVTDGIRSVSFTQGTNLLLTARTPLGFMTTNVYSGSDTNFPVPYTSLLEKMVRPETNAPYFQYWNAVGGVSAQLHGSGAWSLSYFGEVTQVRDPIGNGILQTHNTNGWLTAWTDEAGKTIGMRYDTSGRRTHVTNRLGKVIAMGYDNNDRITALTNELGRVTTFAYTNLVINGFTMPKLRQITHPDSTTETFVCDAAGNIIRRTDPSGENYGFSYNNRGQVLTATNPVGGVISFTYNADGTLASRHDPETGFTLFAYDSFKRMTNITHPDSTTRRWIYDADERLTSLTDERANTTTYNYDHNGRLTEAVDAAGKTNRFNYDAQDRVIGSIDRLGRISGLSYDPRGLLAFVTNKNGFRTQFTYDSRQRLASIVEPGFITSQFAYDAEARLTVLTNQNLEATRFTRDATGLITGQTNALGHTAAYHRDTMGRVTNRVDGLGRSFGYRFDQRGLLTNVSHPGIGSASYQRNPLGLLTRITDLNGRQWNFNYSTMGRLQSVSDPLSRSNSFIYDNRGRVQRTTFADGVGVTNTFDAANNLTRRRFSDGTDLQFSYDKLNRVTNAGGIVFTYDAEGRLLSEQTAGLAVNAAYDAGGRLTNLTYNGLFNVIYAYDSRDRLQSVRDTLTDTQLSFVHDAAGRLRFINRPNQIKTIYNYDAAGRLVRIQDGDFSTNIIDIVYTLDAARQVTAADFHAPLDPADYVSTNEHYFSYDNAHQISNAGYTYDVRGRLRNRPGNAFTFDGVSRLTQIDGVTLGYDALNDLVTRTQSGVTTRFVHSRALGMDPIIAERNESNSQFLRFYVWSPAGALLYMIDASNGNAVRFYHFDRVGTTLALTDATGAVTDAYAWTPYGELLARTGTNPQPFTFIGRFGVRQETVGNLFDMRARYYDPVTARFLSRDPLFPRLAEPQSLDPYQYASAQPLRYIDPDGDEETEPDWARKGPSPVGRGSLTDQLNIRTYVSPQLGLELSMGFRIASVSNDESDSEFGYMFDDSYWAAQFSKWFVRGPALLNIDWYGDDSEITVTFDEEMTLPADRDSSCRPDYLVTFPTDASRYVKQTFQQQGRGGAISGLDIQRRPCRFEPGDVVVDLNYPELAPAGSPVDEGKAPESILDDVNPFILIN